MTWSKIQYTELATEAYVIMTENEIDGCEYHNNSHVDAMYKYLEHTNEPYDERLDWAVMFHDIVYDASLKKEWRSGIAFYDMSQKHHGCELNLYKKREVFDLIMATESHLLENNSPLYSAIVRADLHGLTNTVTRLENFVKIMKESMTLYGIDERVFSETTIAFMKGLYDRVEQNKLIDRRYIDFYSQVQHGIDITIKLSKAHMGDKDV